MKGKDAPEIIEFVKEVLNDARIYCGFQFEEFKPFLKELSEEQKNLITRFQFLDIDQVYEVLLAFYNKLINNRKNYTNKQFNSDIERLWVFSFRAKMMGINPSEYEKIFAEHCKHIRDFKSQKMDRMSVDFYKKLKKLVINNENFKEGFATELEYKEGGNNGLINYLLDVIIRKHNPGIKIAYPTIEHILPKNPEKWGLKRRDIQDFVNDIGNLTLLFEDDNKDLGNATMDEKVKRVFSKSHFKFNRDLAKKQGDFEQNSQDAIEKRGEELAEIANEIWQIKI